MYHYAGLTDLAEAAFRRGRDLDPVLPQAYWMHGRMLLYQGKAHEAEEEVRRALERFPNQFKLMMFLGYFLYQQGKSDEGMQALDRSLEISRGSSDEEPIVLAAILHASRGERDKIDPRILSLKPEEIVDGDLAEWVGAMYAQLGEKEKALACLRQAVRRGNHNYPWFQRDKTVGSGAERARIRPHYVRSRRILEALHRVVRTSLVSVTSCQEASPELASLCTSPAKAELPILIEGVTTAMAFDCPAASPMGQ